MFFDALLLVFKMLSLGQVVLHNVFMTFPLPKTLVKHLVTKKPSHQSGGGALKNKR